MVPDLRENARDGVILLEAQVDMRLDEVPVGERDQWTANVRGMFRDLGVDLNNLDQANAAFMGARLAVTTLMTPSPTSGRATAHLLRYLMDKSDGYKDNKKRRRLRIWLSNKIMPKQ